MADGYRHIFLPPGKALAQIAANRLWLSC